MYSRVKSMGHPLHLMLVNFPIGLLVTAPVFDVIHWITGNGFWSELAFWMIGVGCACGLLAALIGAVDWTGIPTGTNAKKVGIWHGLVNTLALVLFIVSWLLRLHDPGNPSIIAYVLVFLGGALLNPGSWLGGELTGRFGIGIEEDADVNAPILLPPGIPANPKETTSISNVAENETVAR